MRHKRLTPHQVTRKPWENHCDNDVRGPNDEKNLAYRTTVMSLKYEVDSFLTGHLYKTPFN